MSDHMDFPFAPFKLTRNIRYNETIHTIRIKVDQPVPSGRTDYFYPFLNGRQQFGPFMETLYGLLDVTQRRGQQFHRWRQFQRLEPQGGLIFTHTGPMARGAGSGCRFWTLSDWNGTECIALSMSGSKQLKPTSPNAVPRAVAYWALHLSLDVQVSHRPPVPGCDAE